MADLDRALRELTAIASVDIDTPPPRPDWVRAAEGELGHRLPPSFVRFLTEAGRRTLTFWDVYRVLEPGSDAFDIVRANRRERARRRGPMWPSFAAWPRARSGRASNLPATGARARGPAPSAT